MKTITVRIDDNVLDRVDGLAIELSRSRSLVVNQVIMEYEEWVVQEVKDGLREVENWEIATPEEVAAQFRNWGANVD